MRLDEAQLREAVRTYLKAMAEKLKEILDLSEELGKRSPVAEEDYPIALKILGEEIESLDVPPDFKWLLRVGLDRCYKKEPYVV